MVTRAALVLFHAATALPQPEDAEIHLATDRFTLEILPGTCQARLKYGDAQGHLVPFVSLFNDVDLAMPHNFDPCTTVAELTPRQRRKGVRVLRVAAAHGQGSVDISCRATSAYVQFSVSNVSSWTPAAAQRHISFGFYWRGLLDLDNRTTHPLVMGKLMGPYGIPAASFSAATPLAAGFVPVGRGSYYNTVFSVGAGSARAQLAFTAAPTAEVPSVWTQIGRDLGMLQDNPNRFDSWMWTPVTEWDKEIMVSRAKALGANLLFIDQAMNDYNWTFFEHKFPSGINVTASWIRSQGIKVGLHTLPYPPTELTENDAHFRESVLVPEGLAPTFRSGNTWTKRGTPQGNIPTEDLGWWFGHDQKGNVAGNGNPRHNWYGWECPQAAGDLNCSRWGSNMTLVNTSWSTAGVYRDGGAIGFNGQDAHGFIPFIPTFNSATNAMTLGLTLHYTSARGGMPQCLAERPGSWKLWLDTTPDDGSNASGNTSSSTVKLTLHWLVHTTAGDIAVNASAGATPPQDASSDGCRHHSRILGNGDDGCGGGHAVGSGQVTIKVTYNASTLPSGGGAAARIFVNNKLAGSSGPTDAATARAHPASLPTILPSTAGIFIGASTGGDTSHTQAGGMVARGEQQPHQQPQLSEYLAGALEEIYFKNVSTENRKAYIYTDNARYAGSAQGGITGAYIFDFTRQSARDWYAQSMSRILNTADFDVTQFDGFEVNFLVGGTDWPHSRRTFSSGMYRGEPAPDWYHLGFPTRWGLGILQALDDTHTLLNKNTAVECSFLAPGLGPFRPDMAPYVDQNLQEAGGVERLGLEWHPKMLLRTAASGTVINPCHLFQPNPLARTPPTAAVDSISRAYVQHIQYVTIWWNTASVSEVDYWFGGLVSGGITPQLGWTWSENTTLVSAVQKWLHWYEYYGHLNESSVVPLFYDERCCHIEGVCEWVACEDIVLSTLTGGTLHAEKTGAVAGIYGGSSHAVTVAAELVRNDSTLLLFQAANVSHLAIDLGRAADTTLPLAMMSDVVVIMGGGWWLLQPGQRVEKVVHRLGHNGSVVATAEIVVHAANETRQLRHKIVGALGTAVTLQKHIHRPY